MLSPIVFINFDAFQAYRLGIVKENLLFATRQLTRLFMFLRDWCIMFMCRVAYPVEQTHVMTCIALISHVLCYANSAVNPLIYNFMSGKCFYLYLFRVFCSYLLFSSFSYRWHICAQRYCSPELRYADHVTSSWLKIFKGYPGWGIKTNCSAILWDIIC